MKCNEVLQHLNEYIENDLDERLMDEIRNHMEACSKCRKVYEDEKELNDMFLEALNSESIEFNSRIGNIMNMIDKDKYSLQKEENEVIEPAEDNKVIKFESVNKEKEKKLIFNKKIIAMAATFTIMIFMAPFIIGEQNKDMDYAVENNKSTGTFGQDNYHSNKADDMISNKENEKAKFSASVEKSEEAKEEINEFALTEDVVMAQLSDEQDCNNEGNIEAQSNEKPVVADKKSILRVVEAVDYKARDLEEEHKITLSNEKSTTIKTNNQEEDLGIIEGKITSFVEDNEYVYIACVGKGPEKESAISKIIKVNIKTNKIDIIYTSLKKESVVKLELEEEKIKITTISGKDQEMIQYIEK